jgi:hypothetical protein
MCIFNSFFTRCPREMARNPKRDLPWFVASLTRLLLAVQLENSRKIHNNATPYSRFHFVLFTRFCRFKTRQERDRVSPAALKALKQEDTINWIKPVNGDDGL